MLLSCLLKQLGQSWAQCLPVGSILVRRLKKLLLHNKICQRIKYLSLSFKAIGHHKLVIAGC